MLLSGSFSRKDGYNLIFIKLFYFFPSSVRILLIVQSTPANAIAIQVQDGSWWNTFSNVSLNSDDVDGKNNTKGLHFEKVNGAQPNANNIQNCRFNQLHYGIKVQKGYDNNDVNSRFEKVRYHYYLNDNRFKSVNSNHEKGDADLLQLDFTLGTSTINPGDRIRQGQNIYADVVNVEVVSGSWLGGDAAGTLSLCCQYGTFQPGFIDVDSTHKATIAGNSEGGYFLITTTADAGYNFLNNVGYMTSQKADIIDKSGGKLVAGDGLFVGSTVAGTWQTVPYPPADPRTINIDLSKGCFIRVGQLTGNIAVNNPTHALNGMIMLIKFNNDSHNAKTITWGSEFTNVPYTSISQSKQAIVIFVRVDTGAWNQIGTVQEFN